VLWNLQGSPAGPGIVAPQERLFWSRYLFLYSAITAAVFSMIRYKTPWNLLPFYAGFTLLAGIGAALAFERLRPGIVRSAAFLLLMGACCHLAMQNSPGLSLQSLA
jgi:hypothetical protein